MKKIHVIFFALTLLLTTSHLQAQNDPKQERYDRLKQMEQAADRSINFYGLVKDQFGQPVADAKVTCGIECFSLTALYFVDNKAVSAITDSNGSFTINTTGKSLYVRDIKKEGYYYNNDDNPKQSFEYSNVKATNFFTPNPGNPVIFVLHKKPQPGFVIEKYFKATEKKSGFKYKVNLPNGLFDFDDQFYNKQQTHFVFSVMPTTSPNEYKLEMTANDNKGGFMDQDGEPHIAPETGFNPLFTLILKAGGTLGDVEH